MTITKLKIAFIDIVLEPDKPGKSGLSDLVWQMASELISLGHDPHIIASYRTTKYPDERITVHNFSTPPIGYRNVVGQLIILYRASRIVKKIQPDIIHAPDYLSTCVSSILNRNTKIVLTTPGNIFERINNVNPFDLIGTETLKLAARISARKCHMIIATSNTMRDWWIYSGSLPKQVVTIPLGVDVKKFRLLNNGKYLLGFDNRFSVLFVGRLNYENGCEKVLEGFKDFHQIYPNSVLDIVGDGEEKNRLMDLAENHKIKDSIRWHGVIPFDKLPLYYSACDVFVFPRLSRVTPRVLFEAMACKKTVISSDIGGINEFIKDGENGHLVDPKNFENITEKLIWIINNQNKSMSPLQ